MGGIVTEARKLSLVIGVTVALTFLATIFTPVIPTLITPGYYPTGNDCLWTDPPDPDCLKNPDRCHPYGCPPPQCTDDCPYFTWEYRSIVNQWTTDHTLVIEKNIEFINGYAKLGDSIPGSIEGSITMRDDMPNIIEEGLPRIIGDNMTG